MHGITWPDERRYILFITFAGMLEYFFINSLESSFCCNENYSLNYSFHRTHAIRFTNSQIETYFKKEDRAYIYIWRDLFLFSKTLECFCRRVKDIAIICGKKYNTKEVQETKQHLRIATTISGNINI